MTNWYEVTAKYVAEGDGGQKKVSEKYLVKAVCVADAERTVMEDVAKYVSGEIDIRSAVQRDITEIFRREGRDKWYKAKLWCISIDEKTGNEKRTAFYVYAGGLTLRDALDGVEDGMRGVMLDWEFSSLQETSVTEVYGD